MLIWLLRHGESEAGSLGRYEGRLDTPLSGRGRASLRRAGFSPEVVYITNKRRTAETAALLFPEAEQRVIPELREMDFGAFEGRSWREMEQDAEYRAWVEGGCKGRCPGGEDQASFSARVCAAFRELVDRTLREGRETLVIVAHGGTQMAVLDRWGQPCRDYFAWCAKPGRGYVLDAAAWPEALTVAEELDLTEGGA